MKPVLTITLNPAVDITYRLEHLQRGSVNRVAEVWRTPGGKGINVLRVLHALGSSAINGTGFLAGNAGDWLERTLTEGGVPFAPYRVTGETRSTIAIVTDSGPGVTELIEPGPFIGNSDAVGFLSHLESLLVPGQFVLLSGSQPKGLAENYVGTILQLARRVGCVTCVDAGGIVLRTAIAQSPDIVKVNAAEFADWLGESRELDAVELAQQAKRLIVGDTKLVVVTMGSAGSIAISGKQGWLVGAPNINAVNPVGSGDAFFAGLAHGLASGRSLQDSLVEAAAAGASNAMLTAAGCVSPDDVQQLSLSVTLTPLML